MKDEDWLIRLFRCLPEAERHHALVALAEEVILARLVGKSALETDQEDDRDWLRREAIDDAIESVRPFCEIEWHVGDWWTNILENLFQDGKPDALLGSEKILAGYNELLLDLIKEMSEMQSLGVSTAEAELAADFLRQWR